MASVHREVVIARPVAAAWDALADVGALQAFTEDESSCRVVWTADFLPNDDAARIAGMIEHGLSAMRRTLEEAPIG